MSSVSGSSVQSIFLGDVHGFVDNDGASATPPSAVHQRRVVQLEGEPTLEPEFAWSQLRDTFEYRDFDDSLVFVE